MCWVRGPNAAAPTEDPAEAWVRKHCAPGRVLDWEYVDGVWGCGVAKETYEWARGGGAGVEWILFRRREGGGMARVWSAQLYADGSTLAQVYPHKIVTIPAPQPTQVTSAATVYIAGQPEPPPPSKTEPDPPPTRQEHDFSDPYLVSRVPRPDGPLKNRQLRCRRCGRIEEDGEFWPCVDLVPGGYLHGARVDDDVDIADKTRAVDAVLAELRAGWPPPRPQRWLGGYSASEALMGPMRERTPRR